MKALVFNGVEDIRHETVTDPRIESPHDVIVKVSQAAICGSDLHPYYGREEGLDAGTVMGHEFSGEVVEVGSEVNNFKVGDRIASPFTTNCGTCFYCTTGLTCRCERGQLFGWVQEGKGLQGAQAEFVRVPMADATLMYLPPTIDDELGLMLGDILPTGFFAANGADIKADGTYAVIGCGPVGLMALVCARYLGAQKVYALDMVPERLAMAESLGAIPVNVGKEDPCSVLAAATQGRGADAVMELVGSESAARLAYDLIRPGGTISVAGVHTSPHFAFSPAQAYDKNITYRVGRCPARFYMERVLPLAAEMGKSLRDIISHRIPLAEGRRGYQIFAGKQECCTKVMLQP